MKKIITLVTLIILVASMITGCGSGEIDAKDLYKNYFVKCHKITTEFTEEVQEIGDKFTNRKITKKKLNKKLNKLADNAIEDLEELKSRLEKEKVNGENKRLKIYATTYIHESERFISVCADSIINHKGYKSRLAIEKRKDILYDAGNEFIHWYNSATGEDIGYFRR